MVNENSNNALVVMNSFDCDKDVIEDLMTEHRIVTEVFEIDRLRIEDRNDYFNCFNEIYKSKELPLIFLKNQFIGNLS